MMIIPQLHYDKFATKLFRSEKGVPPPPPPPMMEFFQGWPSEAFCHRKANTLAQPPEKLYIAVVDETQHTYIFLADR